MKATDVFTPTKYPTVTLVTDHLADMKQAYRDAMDEGGKLVRVVGPSKSGKTVFLKSVVSEGMTITVTGAGASSPDELWTRVLHAIGSDTGEETERTEGTSGGHAVSGEASGSILVASGKAAAEVTRGRSAAASIRQTKATSLLQRVIADLANSGLTVFIDDFHYVHVDVQTALAQQLKQAVESGVKIVAAAVPFRSEDVLRANDDLQGRIADFTFEYWTTDELLEIAHLGFAEMNIAYSDDYVRSLALEAAGSPQLMQSLCLETCRELKVYDKSATPVATGNEINLLAAVCQRVSTSVDFSTTIKVMREGPLTRGNSRKAYVLKNGTAADVYQIIVEAIGLYPPTLHFTYADMQKRIADLCQGDSPHFADPCSHMARLVNDRYQSDKIDWDADQHLFSLRDPYLLFAIRWSE